MFWFVQVYCTLFKLIQYKMGYKISWLYNHHVPFIVLYRQSKFRDGAELSREMSQLPGAAEGRRATAADFVTWDAGNSTGFDADTSKV